MSGLKFIVPRGVVFEQVGGELMVVVPGRTDVVKLTGEAAEVFLDVQAGRTSPASAQLTSDLEALGIIEASGMSRRGLIKAGAIGAGAGIAVMAMPGVAAAASGACFTPATFLVTTSMNTGAGPFYERLVAIFNRDHPVGLVAAIPIGHPGTFTPTTGDPFPVTWDGEKFDSGFVLNRPFSDNAALQLGSVTFTLNGCAYTGADDTLR